MRYREARNNRPAGPPVGGFEVSHRQIPVIGSSRTMRSANGRLGFVSAQFHASARRSSGNSVSSPMRFGGALRSDLDRAP